MVLSLWVYLLPKVLMIFLLTFISVCWLFSVLAEWTVSAFKVWIKHCHITHLITTCPSWQASRASLSSVPLRRGLHSPTSWHRRSPAALWRGRVDASLSVLDGVANTPGWRTAAAKTGGVLPVAAHTTRLGWGSKGWRERREDESGWEWEGENVKEKWGERERRERETDRQTMNRGVIKYM